MKPREIADPWLHKLGGVKLDDKKKSNSNDIVTIIESKNKIENNPFANFPEETLRDVLDLLDDHLENIKDS
jgi:hypothetical protein